MFFCMISKISWLCQFFNDKNCKSYKLHGLKEMVLCLSRHPVQELISHSYKLQLFHRTMEPLWWFVHLNQSYLSISELAEPIPARCTNSSGWQRLTEFVKKTSKRSKHYFWPWKTWAFTCYRNLHMIQPVCPVKRKMFSSFYTLFDRLLDCTSVSAQRHYNIIVIIYNNNNSNQW